MRVVTRGLAVLAVFETCTAASLGASGVYNLIVGGLALTHVSTTVTSPITATALTGATSQAWTVIFNPTTKQATLQSIATRAFAAASGSFFEPSTSPFSWTLNSTNGQTLFCTSSSLSFCISTSGSTVGLASTTSGAPQKFDVEPIIPPSVGYQVTNVASNTIFGTGFVPSPAFVSRAPATDRSQIWVANNLGGSQITLKNFDQDGFFGVADNGTVGVFSQSIPFPWTVAFITGVGQLLLSTGGFLTVTNGTTARVGNLIDPTAAWIFDPVNLNDFLP